MSGLNSFQVSQLKKTVLVIHYLSSLYSNSVLNFWFCVVRYKEKNPLPVFSTASCKCVTILHFSLQFPKTYYFIRIRALHTQPDLSVCKTGKKCFDPHYSSNGSCIFIFLTAVTTTNTSNNHHRVTLGFKRLQCDNETYSAGSSDTHLLLKATAMVSIAFSKSILSASLQAS